MVYWQTLNEMAKFLAERRKPSGDAPSQKSQALNNPPECLRTTANTNSTPFVDPPLALRNCSHAAKPNARIEHLSDVSAPPFWTSMIP